MYVIKWLHSSKDFAVSLCWPLLFVIDPHILHLQRVWIGVALSVYLNGVTSTIMAPVTCMCLPWPPMSDLFSGLFIDIGCLRCFPPLCCPLLPSWLSFSHLSKTLAACQSIRPCTCVPMCSGMCEFIWDLWRTSGLLQTLKCIYTKKLPITVLATGWFKVCSFEEYLI